MSLCAACYGTSDRKWHTTNRHARARRARHSAVLDAPRAFLAASAAASTTGCAAKQAYVLIRSSLPLHEIGARSHACLKAYAAHSRGAALSTQSSIKHVARRMAGPAICSSCGWIARIPGATRQNADQETGIMGGCGRDNGLGILRVVPCVRGREGNPL